MKKFLLVGSCLFLLTGCFETDFGFKTTIKPNGSIVRETKIDGRGANRFVAPSGPGWEVKTYETKGGQSILEDTYYHIHAFGRFKSASEIRSDYQFDTSKQFSDISDEERKNFIDLGIVEPFEENIYSKNFVEVVKHHGIFKSTYEYQEIFQNKGIIQLLLNDIKKEIIREQAVTLPSQGSVKGSLADAASKASTEPATATAGLKPAEDVTKTPKVTIEGQLLSSHAVETIARERLAKDTLSKFKFRSEVSLPGEIVSSNAGSLVGSTAVWEFSLADFELNYSRYILTARSQMVEWKTVSLLVILIGVILFGMSFARKKTPKKRSPKK